ncbi:MAG: hypothetical protein V3V49_06970 [Candidatus Krumholzibacteria bacterium]
MVRFSNRVVRETALGAGILAILFFSPQTAPAQEDDKASVETTVEALVKAITGYIDEDSKLKGGYFLVYDTVDKKPLQLQLLEVHQSLHATADDGVYFACADMKAADGTVYDLDFFMKQTDEGIETTEVTVHKKSGKPRYGWKEVDGIWKKVKS